MIAKTQYVKKIIINIKIFIPCMVNGDDDDDDDDLVDPQKT